MAARGAGRDPRRADRARRARLFLDVRQLRLARLAARQVRPSRHVRRRRAERTAGVEVRGRSVFPGGRGFGADVPRRADARIRLRPGVEIPRVREEVLLASAARVTLDAGREFTLPTQIRVDSVSPTARLVSYKPHVLRRHAKPRVAIAYRVSEKAHVIVYVNGKRDVIGGAKALRYKVDWFARRN